MRTYYIKNVPKPVLDWFIKKYPAAAGYTLKFYKYFSNNPAIVPSITYYGCEVYLNGELWSYFAQGTEEDFADDFKPMAI